MKIQQLFILLFVPMGVCSQSIGMDIGMSSAQYIYTDSQGASTVTLTPDSSISMAVYRRFDMRSSDYFRFQIGIRYQEMNAYGYQLNVPLTYSTKYISLLSEMESSLVKVYFKNYCKNCSGIMLKASWGVEIAKLISGTQVVGFQNSYKLAQEAEFNGLLFGSTAGVAVDIDVLSDLIMRLKYTQTYFFNSHSKPERLHFNRRILSLGLIKEF